MSTRYLVAAAVLLGSACAAQADVLPSSSTAPVSTYLTSWTSNGTDIASSGVLGSGTSLVGGSTYGSGSLTESLMQQASSTVGTSSKLSYEKGVNGTYVVATSNFKTAAMIGEGVSLVAGNNGSYTLVTNPATTTTTTSSGVATGGGSATGSSPTTVSTPSTVKTPTGGSGSGTGSTTGDSSDVTVSLPSDVGGGGSIGAGLPVTPLAAGGTVPEPSSIALLFAGMLGALALNRRSKR